MNTHIQKQSPPLTPRPTLARWVEQLQSEGRYTFTRGEVEARTDRSFVAAQSALRRLKKQDRIVSPRRGFYVVVPPEYRTAGSPPASWFIDDLMCFLKQPYYVALLSAAAIHGAAHEQPMIFQIMTNKPTREISSGRVVIRSSMNLQTEQMPVTNVQTETGSMQVATPETTAFDLVRYPAGAGYLSNAATVIAELAERLDANTLAKVVPLVRMPDVQRLGYLLEAVGERRLATPLAGWLQTRRPRVVPLRPGIPAEEAPDRRWHVVPNEKLELDL